MALDVLARVDLSVSFLAHGVDSGIVLGPGDHLAAEHRIAHLGVLGAQHALVHEAGLLALRLLELGLPVGVGVVSAATLAQTLVASIRLLRLFAQSAWDLVESRCAVWTASLVESLAFVGCLVTAVQMIGRDGASRSEGLAVGVLAECLSLRVRVRGASPGRRRA